MVIPAAAHALMVVNTVENAIMFIKVWAGRAVISSHGSMLWQWGHMYHLAIANPGHWTGELFDIGREAIRRHRV